MKKIILLSIMFNLFFTVQAQKLAASEVPQAVIAAFRKSNPTVSNPEWKMDKSNYQARYVFDKRQRLVTYSKTGTPVVHDSKVAIAALPPGVKVYLDKNFPGHSDELDKVIKITKPDGVVNYDIEIDGKDLIFDDKGKYLKTLKK